MAWLFLFGDEDVTASIWDELTANDYALHKAKFNQATDTCARQLAEQLLDDLANRELFSATPLLPAWAWESGTNELGLIDQRLIQARARC